MELNPREVRGKLMPATFSRRMPDIVAVSEASFASSAGAWQEGVHIEKTALTINLGTRRKGDARDRDRGWHLPRRRNSMQCARRPARSIAGSTTLS